MSSNDWLKANEELASTVVPAAISCSTVDEKNKILCEGVHQYFSQLFGTKAKQAHHSKRARRHNRRLKRLTQLKNESRRELRKAKKDGLDEATMRTVAKEFHRLLRLHSKESKLSNKSKANMEARKARSDCAKAFWRFASRLLDEDEVNVSPAFSVDDAESFFKKVYSCNPKPFSRPEWLPVPSFPHTPFNDDAISFEEIRRVMTYTTLAGPLVWCQQHGRRELFDSSQRTQQQRTPRTQETSGQ